MRKRSRSVVWVLHQPVPLIIIFLIQVASVGLMVHPFKNCTPWAWHENEHGALPAEQCHQAIHLVFLAQSDIGIKGVTPEMNLAIRLEPAVDGNSLNGWPKINSQSLLK